VAHELFLTSSLQKAIKKKKPTAARLIFTPQRSRQPWKICRVVKIKEKKNRKKKHLVCKPYFSIETTISVVLSVTRRQNELNAGSCKNDNLSKWE